MSNLNRGTKGKITSVLLTATTAIWLSGAAVLMPTVAYGQTVADLQAQIATLLAQITALQTQLAALSGGSSGAVCGYAFSADLKVGSTGADVKNLQTVLNSDSATQLGSSGAGSPGNETSYFGSITKAGVIKFQDKYASEVLTPIGLSAGTGYVGSMSRAKLNTLYGTCASTDDTTTITDDSGDTVVITPAGTGLTVTEGTQPASSLFPGNVTAQSARVPFTVVHFTASADGDVTIDSLTVERIGLGEDANFAGVVLLDELGLQLGISKTLNSDHQVILSEDFIVKAGETRTMTIAGNRDSATTRTGQIVYLSLTEVDANDTTVHSSLPISGAGHTISTTLTIGTARATESSFDNDTSATKDIGLEGYTYSAIKVTAGSKEKIRIHSIRWNETGSISKDNLENVKVYADNVAYDTTISGNYYTAYFNDGIVVDKGMFKEILIKADIASGSGRTVVFDIYKATDLHISGETYGYGITPTQSDDGTASDSASQFTAGTPWFDGAAVTISAGTIQISKSTAVTSQNVVENVSDQPLGGFDVEVKGEDVTVGSMVFRFSAWYGSGGTAATQDITNITLVDANGNVIAGPTDITASSASVTLTDTVTFPVGKNLYTLKGKLHTDYANNDTIVASTTPSSDWTSITGVTTGDTITAAPTADVTGSTMTVKAATSTISVSSLPLAQTVVAGGAFTFAKYNIDLTQSGEDIQLNSFKARYQHTSGPATDLTSCSLYDGATALSTGSNVIDPGDLTLSSGVDADTTFTFDDPLIVTKGTIKTLDLTCNTSATTSTGNIVQWGLSTHGSAAQAGTGVESGTSLTSISGIAINDSTGQAITLTTGGSYTVVNDSTLGYNIVTPGTEVTLLKLKFSASYESIDLQKVAFELKNTASNTALDLVGSKVTLYNGTTAIGTALFANNGDNATSTLIAIGDFTIPQGGSKSLTVKGTIAGISYEVGPLQKSGDLLVVAYDGSDNNSTTPGSGGNYGKGVSGGTSVITGTTSDVTPGGVRIMKSLPTFEKIALSASEKVLQNGSNAPLYKFKMSADSNGDVAIYNWTFDIGSSTGANAAATTSAYGLYVYTNSSFSLADTSFSTDGLLNTTNYWGGDGLEQPKIVEIYPLTSANATTTYTIPAGTTRYFVLKATVSNVETGTGSEAITVKLEGDAAYPLIDTPGDSSTTEYLTMAEAASTSAFTTHDDFRWSPISTTTNVLPTDLDWTNGYAVPGLPSTYMSSETLTSTS